MFGGMEANKRLQQIEELEKKGGDTPQFQEGMGQIRNPKLHKHFSKAKTKWELPWATPELAPRKRKREGGDI